MSGELRERIKIVSERWINKLDLECVFRVDDSIIEKVLATADPPRSDAVVRFVRTSQLGDDLKGEIWGIMLGKYYGIDDLD